jgi:hypothetical protein
MYSYQIVSSSEYPFVQIIKGDNKILNTVISAKVGSLAMFTIAVMLLKGNCLLLKKVKVPAQCCVIDAPNGTLLLWVKI